MNLKAARLSIIFLCLFVILERTASHGRSDEVPLPASESITSTPPVAPISQTVSLDMALKELEW
jgi:hypothetical protein